MNISKNHAALLFLSEEATIVCLWGAQELQSMMEGGSQHRWGNHMGYLIVNIPLKHQLDPLDYVRAAKKMTDKKKASLEGIFTYVSGAALMNLTGPIVSISAIQYSLFYLPSCTFILSTSMYLYFIYLHVRIF